MSVLLRSLEVEANNNNKLIGWSSISPNTASFKPFLVDFV